MSHVDEIKERLHKYNEDILRKFGGNMLFVIQNNADLERVAREFPQDIEYLLSLNDRLVKALNEIKDFSHNEYWGAEDVRQTLQVIAEGALSKSV